MKISWNTLSQWIDNGLGFGHFEWYKAFLRITRRKFPRRSNQVVGVLPGFRRRFDFWSRTERKIGLLGIWLGVLDVREQYPVWPWSHPHPLADWPLFPMSFPDAPALLAVAREAGIEHGTYVGSTVPYVATTDLLLTVGSKEQPRLVAVACKPRALFCGERADQRVVERLELERRYFQTLGVPHIVADDVAVDATLVANLEAVAPDAALSEALEHFQDRGKAQEVLCRRLEQDTIRDAVWGTASELRCDLPLVWAVFNMLAWTQTIDIDLAKPIHRSLPMCTGGTARRKALRITWKLEAQNV